MERRISRGLVRLSTITRLELGYSARSGEAGWRHFGSPPLSLMPVEHLSPAIEDRALEVQMLLADRGQRRAPSIPDLLIAATAERAGLRSSPPTRTSTSSPPSPANLVGPA